MSICILARPAPAGGLPPPVACGSGCVCGVAGAVGVGAAGLPIIVSAISSAGDLLEPLVSVLTSSINLFLLSSFILLTSSIRLWLLSYASSRVRSMFS